MNKIDNDLILDKDFLLEILDNINDVVMIVDKETNIIYVNKSYTSVLGVPADKVLGKKLSAIEPDSVAIKAMELEKPIIHEVDYLKSVNINTVGISFPTFKNGQVVGGVSVFNDVSKLVRLTEELKHTKEMNNYYQEQLESNDLPKSFKEQHSLNRNFKETLKLAAKVAKTDSTVMIRGESGVGKEVLTKAIHSSSNRKNKPLIKLNCASIPENLLESELFGYEDGAFTGARKGGKIGKFELANGGTIFLDEIGDMSFNMQAKLLRVLQEKEIERIGGTKSIPIDIRIITATNKNLEEMIKEGTFREDLYYRINVVPIYIPPLRERTEDILNITKSILNKLAGTENNIYLSPQVINLFHSYDWPGNIRELQNVLEHANILRNGNEITVFDLPAYLRPKKKMNEVKNTNAFNMKSYVEVIEQELITESYKRNKGNKSATIKELGISRRTFYEKIKKYDIDFDSITNFNSSEKE